MNYKKITMYSSLLSLIPAGVSYAGGGSFIQSSGDIQNHLAGVYGGLHAGQGRSTVKWSEGSYDNSKIEDTSLGEGPEHKTKGALYGGQFGYNWSNSSNVMYGVEFSASAAEMDASSISDVGEADDNWTTEIDQLMTLTGKIGTQVGPSAIGYVKGGIAKANVKLSLVDTNGPALLQGTASSEAWHQGWVVGAGVDVPINKKVSVGVEYNHIVLEDETHLMTDSDGGSVEYNVDIETMNTLAARVNFHFH